MGYGGSGPADLALSILADYLGVGADRVPRVARNAWNYASENPAHWRLHQEFKRDFICGRAINAGESYEIPGAEIAAWLDTFLIRGKIGGPENVENKWG